MEIVERRHAFHDRGQSHRNLGIGGVGVVHYPIYVVPVDGRVKGRFHLSGRPAELENAASARWRFHLEALALQPLHHLGQIVIRHSEQFPKTLGSEPPMILRRLRILLRRQQSFQRPFLRGVRLKNEHHSIHPMVRRNGTRIIRGNG